MPIYKLTLQVIDDKGSASMVFNEHHNKAANCCQSLRSLADALEGKEDADHVAESIPLRLAKDAVRQNGGKP
jgi:hypothetical protein